MSMYLYTYICMYILMYIHMYVCMFLCLYVYICVGVLICVYKREPHPEAAVSLRKMVTFVT